MANDITQGREADGKYAKKTACDGCGKPCTGEHFTDDEVCGGTDGPGFYICERKRCQAKLEPLTVEERRTLYTAQRAINDSRK